MKYTPRSMYLDITKYIAIFLVTWGHVIQYTCLLKNANYDYIYRAIYAFHMPLFMCISGWLISRSISKSGGVNNYIIGKLPYRFTSLIIPMLSCGAVCTIISGDITLDAWMKHSHNVWFLGALIINNISLTLVKLLCNGNFYHDCKYYTIGLLIQFIPLLGYGSHGLLMYIFCMLGFWYNEYFRNVIKITPIIMKTALLMFTIFFILTGFTPYSPLMFTVNIREYPLFDMVMMDILRIIIAASGCVLMLLAVYFNMDLFYKTNVGRNIALRGRYTLDIYIMNIVLIEGIISPVYRDFVNSVGINYIRDFGYVVEIISTLFIAFILQEIMVLISKAINKSPCGVKILFGR